MPQHRMKRFVKYFVYAFVVILLINFGVKAYWKMKSYSFSAYMKDAWTYCHEKGTKTIASSSTSRVHQAKTA